MTPDTDKREGLGEGIYAKFVQNYEKLLKENKSLKENLKLVRRHRDGLEEENENLKAELKQLEERYDRNAELYKRLLEENKKLKEWIKEHCNGYEELGF